MINQMFGFVCFFGFLPSFVYINVSIFLVLIKTVCFPAVLISQEDCHRFSSNFFNRKFCVHFWQMPLFSQFLTFSGFSAMTFLLH